MTLLGIDTADSYQGALKLPEAMLMAANFCIFARLLIYVGALSARRPTASGSRRPLSRASIFGEIACLAAFVPIH